MGDLGRALAFVLSACIAGTGLGFALLAAFGRCKPPRARNKPWDS